ncbi:MAG: hypothetical protein ACYSUI_25815, partial [Planctomycetota bacterium]
MNVDHLGGGSQSFSHSFAGSVGDILTATTTECTDGPLCNAFGSTSEFSEAATVVAARSIGGRVFEDVNYGGGAGRDYATANADSGAFSIERDIVRVELYNAAGNFLASADTAADGSYIFTGLAPALHTVRVVNSTVTSTRTGSDGTEIVVQTFRADGDGEAVGTGAN